MKKITWTPGKLVTLALVVCFYLFVAIAEPLAPSSWNMLFMVLKKGSIYALIAASVNLLTGFTGLFSLGTAGFMLLGAYTYCVFTILNDARSSVYQYYANGGIIHFTIPVPLALILAGLVAAGFAFLIGLPVLRLKSDYLAIATLGFAEIIRAVFQWDKIGPITNGSNLLRKFPVFQRTLPYLIVVGICIAVIFLLINSSFGRAFKAIREDEIAAEAMGIRLSRHKMWAFCISAFFTGIGGALLAMYQTSVQAMIFKTAMTYEILLIVVIGGMGSITGSILASFLYIACSEWWLRFLDNEMILSNGTKVPLLRNGFRMVVFSVVIMIIVLFFRKGLMGTKELPQLFDKKRKTKANGEEAAS